MACGVGNAEVDGHRVDEGRFGQRHAACAEVRRHLEGQAVAASGHGAGVKQRPAVVAAVVVGFSPEVSGQVGALDQTVARLSSYEPLDGRRHWTGRIVAVEGGTVSLEEKDGGAVTRIPFEKIAHGRLEVEFK